MILKSARVEKAQTLPNGWKPYSAYKDSGVEWLGEVPEGWEVKKIKHTTYVKGRIGWKGLRSDEFIDEGPYLVTGTDFVDGVVNWESCYHVHEERYNEDPYIQLRENDLLITKDGTIGKTAIVRDLPYKASLNSGVFVTRPISGDYITDFMYWVLNSRVFSGFIDYTKSGSTISHLYQNVFVGFSFPVPSIEQQRTIAAFLDRETSKIDSMVAKKERLIGLLEEKRTALISHAVTKGLDPDAPMTDSGVEWLGEVPLGWNVVSLRWYLSIRSGEFITNALVEPTPNGDMKIPVIGGNGLLGYTSAPNVLVPTIVIGRVGALCGNIHLINCPSWITDNALIITNVRDFDIGSLLRFLYFSPALGQPSYEHRLCGLVHGHKIQAKTS